MSGLVIYENGTCSEYSNKQLAEEARKTAEQHGTRMKGWHIEVLATGSVRLHIELRGGGEIDVRL